MLPSLSTTNSITTDGRSSSCPSDVSCVESRSGSMGKVATPVYTDVAFVAAYVSVAEPLATVPSTSAIATRTFTSPLVNRSAISSWSRSLDESLSMDDQGSTRRSVRLAGALTAGSLAFATSASTAAGRSGAKPFASIARWAPVRRSKGGGLRFAMPVGLSNDGGRGSGFGHGPGALDARSHALRPLPRSRGLRQRQDRVGRRRVAHELPDVGGGVARLVQRRCEPHAGRGILVLRQPGEAAAHRRVCASESRALQHENDHPGRKAIAFLIQWRSIGAL